MAPFVFLATLPHVYGGIIYGRTASRHALGRRLKGGFAFKDAVAATHACFVQEH